MIMQKNSRINQNEMHFEEKPSNKIKINVSQNYSV